MILQKPDVIPPQPPTQDKRRKQKARVGAVLPPLAYTTSIIHASVRASIHAVIYTLTIALKAFLHEAMDKELAKSQLQ